MNPFFIAAASAERDEMDNGNKAEVAQTATPRPQKPRKLRRVRGFFMGCILRSGFKTSDQVSRLNAGLHVLILTN
jgi:hypothetical protein